MKVRDVWMMLIINPHAGAGAVKAGTVAADVILARTPRAMTDGTIMFSGSD